MKSIFDRLINSFDNENSGFSARKLSAFIAVITAIVITFRFGSTDHIEVMLLIWLGFGLLALGIITMQQIINFKNGNSNANAQQ